MANKLTVPIVLTNKESLDLIIYEEVENTLSQISDAEASEFGESPYQLKEGTKYEYKLPEGYTLEKSEIVSRSHINESCGRINTNIYVGTFPVNIYKGDVEMGKVLLEIRSIKTNYRSDYRTMLEDITSHCTELLMQQSSLVNQHFTTDINNDPKTLYQRFAFINSIIDSDDFNDALHQIHISPVKRWKDAEVSRDICNIKRLDHRTIKQVITKTNRVQLPSSHPLKEKMCSIPNKVNVHYKEETLDIPENRFIKFVLETFFQLCTSIYENPKASDRLKREAKSICDKLNMFLSYSIFKGISRLTILPLNSSVLQQKEGYREVLQAWFMFDMAAKLIWRGGENVYEGGKRNVAVLYEYWLFFKLLEIMEEVFHIKPAQTDNLIEIVNDELELRLKQGRLKVIRGTYITENRKLHIEFCYNKTFSSQDNYPNAGSWTKNMRPDYTLSIWPEGISYDEAEKQELIIHIHFDAKYKIDNYNALFTDVDPDEEKTEQAKGNYKRADLLKMHAYKDAIRRTAGAYILYPGTEKKEFHNFHEILPGLGAFAISPSQVDNGTKGIKTFLHDVINHFLNRASQREKIAYHTYDTLNQETHILKENLPEPYNTKRDLIPDETYVLVAYYRSKEQLDWILKNQLYNTRTETRRGSLRLNKENTSARYLLLHGDNETKTGRLFKLNPEGPRVFSKEKLIELKYPAPSQLYYIVYKIIDEPEKEFKDIKWDITQLAKYQAMRNSSLPFSVSLTELMKSKVK
jgi:predicted component of viral defense system (DUF524 family)